MASAEWKARNFHYLAEQQRTRNEKRSRLVGIPRTGAWTSAEDQIALRTDISQVEKVVLLQRSYGAVSNRLSILRSSPKRCKRCGGEYLSSRRGTSYCSVECNTNPRFSRRNCEGCGSDFRPRGAAQRFCSKVCKPAPVREECGCEECGKQFLPKRLGHRFCSRSCASKHTWRSRVRYPKPPVPAAPKKCLRCRKELTMKSRGRHRKYCQDRHCAKRPVKGQ
ncbi:hypothetical protein MycrhDRAFT_5741 [Mycolicibacterium rhodesiae JS60]|nr:hypothetical protein MycrhDRAFT_5741 [Mycolicibacterium rhodesiae JS60]